MFQLRRLHDCRESKDFEKFLDFVNQIRANYKWSKVTYDAANSKNILLIKDQTAYFGYLDAEVHNADLRSPTRMYIYVHDLHIAPSKQQSGTGSRVIRHLLSKGLELQFVIAKENEKARRLIGRFPHEVISDNANTQTIRVRPTIDPLVGDAPGRS